MKEKIKIYIAGALFNEAEVAQRKLEGKKLRERFGEKVEIFNPIEQPFNEDKQTLPTPEEIFQGDYKAVLDSDITIADITNDDAGVMVEIGIAYQAGKKIIFVNSDIRLESANKYDYPSYGLNHFVLGMVDNDRVYFARSFDEAMDKIGEIYS